MTDRTDQSLYDLLGGGPFDDILGGLLSKKKSWGDPTLAAMMNAIEDVERHRDKKDDRKNPS